MLPDPRHSEASLAERLDGADYRDDLLRLLFICCHPELPATQQVALALRIVAGVPLAQIARAFLVGESAMEQRITRAKARIAAADVPFETPGAAERAARLETVTAMLYLLFNAGYTGVPPGAAVEGRAFCGEAIRLSFFERLRDEKVFPSMLELTAQIRRDVEATRLWFLSRGEG